MKTFQNVHKIPETWPVRRKVTSSRQAIHAILGLNLCFRKTQIVESSHVPIWQLITSSLTFSFVKVRLSYWVIILMSTIRILLSQSIRQRILLCDSWVAYADRWGGKCLPWDWKLSGWNNIGNNKWMQWLVDFKKYQLTWSRTQFGTMSCLECYNVFNNKKQIVCMRWFTLWANAIISIHSIRKDYWNGYSQNDIAVMFTSSINHLSM